MTVKPPINMIILYPLNAPPHNTIMNCKCKTIIAVIIPFNMIV